MPKPTRDKSDMVSQLSAKVPDYVDWLTKAEAAIALNVAEKTIERMAARGQLQQAFRPVPNRRPVAVFHPGDVEKAKAAAQPAPYVTAGGPVSNDTAALAVRNGNGHVNGQAHFIEALTAALAASRPPAITLDKKMYLSLDETVQYSGLPRAYLLRLLREGKLPAVKLGRWCIKRTDIETALSNLSGSLFEMRNDPI